MSLDAGLYVTRVTADGEVVRDFVFDQNITHNLAPMARAAGIYEACWRPEEHGYETAADILPVLEAGLAKLRADPQHYMQYDSPNGWGLYRNFVPWVERYVDACREYPNARIDVCR